MIQLHFSDDFVSYSEIKEANTRKKVQVEIFTPKTEVGRNLINVAIRYLY